MSREIKFRLIQDGKIVGYERWNSLAGKWCYDTSLDGCFDIKNDFIPHTDKEQFTGLHDKNGREIYEEDIVKLRKSKWPAFQNTQAYAEVQWRDTFLEWMAFEFISSSVKTGQRILTDLSYYAKIDLEVIGDIHTTPALLAEGKEK